MEILIVDDDPITRLALRSTLEEWGFNPIEAKDGNDALRVLERDNPPHLIVLDWSMPRMSGLELCKHVRARNDGQFFYIVMLTGREGTEAVVEAMEAGADDFVAKPFDHRILKVRLAAGSRIVRLEQTLNQLASRDSLTQCWNRRMLEELRDRSIAEAKRNKSPLSLMVIDIDHFKQINDSVGHSAGDLALKQMVDIINYNLREYDQVGRYGGEEFVVVLPGTTSESAWGVAERIRSAIQFQPVIVDEHTRIDMTVSIGMAQFDATRDHSGVDLFARADEALYAAKQGGRNRIVCQKNLSQSR